MNPRRAQDARCITPDVIDYKRPGSGQHRLFAAAGDVSDGAGHLLVTAYPVLRPDGNWALLVVNKDQGNAHRVAVRFDDAVHHRSGAFVGRVSTIVFGRAEYQWHPGVDGGMADPDGPPASTTVEAGGDTSFNLPAASIAVLRGKVSMRSVPVHDAR